MSRQQQIFDWVVAHLTNQAEPAYSFGGCSYRSPGGLTCAVGCLVTEEQYNRPPLSLSSAENSGLSISGYNPDCLGGQSEGDKFYLESTIGLLVEENIPDISSEEFELLRELQQCHDLMADSAVEEWRSDVLERLKETAAHNDFETSQLNYMERRFRELGMSQ